MSGDRCPLGGECTGANAGGVHPLVAGPVCYDACLRIRVLPAGAVHDPSTIALFKRGNPRRLL